MTKQDKIALKQWLTDSAHTAEKISELESLAKQFGVGHCSIKWDNSVYITGIKPIAEAMGYTLEEEDYDDYTRISFVHEGVKFYDYEDN